MNGKVEILKEAKFLTREPLLHTLLVLRKSSLFLLLNEPDKYLNLPKHRIARIVHNSSNKNLKNKIKQIVTCQ